MTTHTPGPFEVQDPMGSDVGLWIVQAGLEAFEWSCIAIVTRDDDRSGKHFITKREQESNARLFAAAPDLLAALTVLADDISERFDMESASTNPGLKAAVADARAAIAKAEPTP